MLLKVQLPARQRPPAYNGTSIGWLCLYWSPDLRKCPVPEAVKACLESKLSVRDGERTRFTTYKLNKSQFLKKVINAATLTHMALISQWKCVSLGFPFYFHFLLRQTHVTLFSACVSRNLLGKCVSIVLYFTRLFYAYPHENAWMET